MQYIRNSVLRHVGIRNHMPTRLFEKDVDSLGRQIRLMCAAAISGTDHLMSRVIGLVKKFDKMNSSKVTETADFQRDLCLDSLDRVELVMAFEQEFSIEIPDEKADKLCCCSDVVKYILSETNVKVPGSS